MAIPNRNQSIFERRFINKVLTEEGKEMFSQQARVLAKHESATTKQILLRRKLSVNDTTLEIEHLKSQRFIDMKTIAGRRRKPIKNHNTILLTQLGSAIRQIRYGFTKDIQELMAQEHKIEI